MSLPTARPLYCRREAYELFIAQVPRLHTPQGLLAASVALSMHQLHDARPDTVEAELEHLVRSIRSRVRGDSPQALLAHAHHVLFDEKRFAGNTEDYYNPHNSYVPWVLQTGRGLPISLSLIYKYVLTRLGLTVCGINAPMHFVVAVQDGPTPEHRVLIDTFDAGRTITEDELLARIRSIAGRPVTRSELSLTPTDHRSWITRMLNNLANIFATTGQRVHLAAMLELRSVLQSA